MLMLASSSTAVKKQKSNLAGCRDQKGSPTLAGEQGGVAWHYFVKISLPLRVMRST